jgi:hypothetical protein
VIGCLLRKPLTWVIVGVLAAGGALGLYWFQPWKLVTDQRVDEALSRPAPAPTAPIVDTTGDATPPATPAGPAVIAEGRFISHEHETTGAARIVELADGSRRLELVGLSTSNGPDLRVWLTDQPVIEGRDGWEVFDDGRYIELGRLKGNQGNQGYDVPADADLTGIRSVSIWCKRFSVSFGAADLNPA